MQLILLCIHLAAYTHVQQRKFQRQRLYLISIPAEKKLKSAVWEYFGYKK